MSTKTKKRYNLVARGYFCTFLEMLKVLHPSCGIARGYSLPCRDKKPLPMSGEVGICHLRQQMAKIPGEGNIPQGMDLFAPSPEAVRLINSPTASTLSRHWERIEVSRLAKCAFTLAEVLITLGIIGVVAAVTLPTLLTNVQERVRQEQVRTVKYKFTKATEKMNSLGLIGHYDSTMDFVNELKKHMSIAKVCDSSKLNECWGYTSFTNANASKTYKVAELTSGKSLEALQFNSGDRDTVGIITGDGVPIILTYGKECQALDESKQYQWSTVNGKPETNATAGCVSMVFDINGPKAPNRVGTDVRTMNSILGMVDQGRVTYNALTAAECNKVKAKLGIKYCGGVEQDYWAAAMKRCDDLGLHLPSMATLAQIATLQYGVTIGVNEWATFTPNCYAPDGRPNPNRWPCKTRPSSDEYTRPITFFTWYRWAKDEVNSGVAGVRYFHSTDYTHTSDGGRDQAGIGILCIAD